jgi:hypothetical protein
MKSMAHITARRCGQTRSRDAGDVKPVFEALRDYRVSAGTWRARRTTARPTEDYSEKLTVEDMAGCYVTSAPQAVIGCRLGYPPVLPAQPGHGAR